MQPAGRPRWQHLTAVISLTAGGAITGFSFVPRAPADLSAPTGMPISLMALRQAARPAQTGDALMRSAIVNVAHYYYRLAETRTPAEMAALIWQRDSMNGANHGESCAAFASLTLELAAQVVGQQSWVTGGSSYPWPLHTWADVRVDPNPASPGIVSVLQDAAAHDRWHPLGDGYEPLPGDWVLFNGHVEVVTKYADDVLHTIGGDSLPNFSVNAHEYRGPLAAQGVVGFVNNGALGGPPEETRRSGEHASAGQPAHYQDAAELAAIPGAPAAGARQQPRVRPAGRAAIPGVPAAAHHRSAGAGASPSARYVRHDPLPAASPPDARSREAFIREVAPGAVATQRRYGVPAAVTIAQAIDESGWGQSELATRDHNLFGIKGTGPAGADPEPTQEYQDGQPVAGTASFRVYHSIAESIDDHARLLATSPYYQKSMADRQRPAAFAASLTGRYATDPDYGEKLIDLMGQYDLYRYDAPATAAAPQQAAVPGNTATVPARQAAVPSTAAVAEQQAAVPGTAAVPEHGQVREMRAAIRHQPAVPGVPAAPGPPAAARHHSATPVRPATPAHEAAVPGEPAATSHHGAGRGRPSALGHEVAVPGAPAAAWHRAPRPGRPATPALPGAPAAPAASRHQAAVPGAPAAAWHHTAGPGRPFIPAMPGAAATSGDQAGSGVPAMSGHAAARRVAGPGDVTIPGLAGAVAPEPQPQVTATPHSPASSAASAPGSQPGADRAQSTAMPSVQTASARLLAAVAPAGQPARRVASRNDSTIARHYQQRIPPSVQRAFTTMARVPLMRAQPLYHDVASHCDIRWELLAACDWMQCEARPRHSPVHGEKLGTANPDGTLYRTKSAALERCAEDLIDLARTVYQIDVTGPAGLSVRELANVYAAFRWGGLLRLHRTSAMEFPYSVAGLTEQHTNMRWPGIDDPQAPDKPGSRFRMPFGAVPAVLSLNYPVAV